MTQHKRLPVFGFCLGVIVLFVPFLSYSQNTHHIDSGLSIRNHQKSHYYPMMSWDESAYKEYAYWEESPSGSIEAFMNFRVAFPPDFDVSRSKALPALLMLHGAGASGRKWTGNFDYQTTDPEYDNNSLQLGESKGLPHLNALKRPADNPTSYNGIIIVPQSSYNGSWGDESIVMIARFIKWMVQRYSIDQDRIVVHGLSNGAKGVWNMASKRPDLFAGALVMSGVGGSDITTMTDILATMPMWMFQGDMDTNPTPAGSKRWYDSLKARDADVRYTLYDSTGHVTWSKAYSEPDFFPWIKARDQRRIQIMGELWDDLCEQPADKPVRLGFSAGFLAYQWTKDGKEIPGATDRYYIADESGIYNVRFKRRTDTTWAVSYAFDVFFNEPNIPSFKPELLASSSTELPIAGNDRSLQLMAQPGFAQYEWYKNGNPLPDSTEANMVFNNVKGNYFNPADTGTYYVKVWDQNGCPSQPSDPIHISYDPTRILGADGPENGILIYPNPSDGIVTVELDDYPDKPLEYSVYDVDGRKLLTDVAAQPKLQLDLSAYAPGVYIISVGNKSYRMIKK